LPPDQAIVAEAGALIFKDTSIQMETILGDGSKTSGVFGSAFSAGKRLMTGEKLFLCRFTNVGSKPHTAGFSAPHLGSIVLLDMAEFGGEVICQKGAFLCATQGSTLGIAWTKKISVGLFGGMGFVLQAIKSRGMVAVHAGGSMIEKTLAPRERIQVDAGCLVAFGGGIKYDVEMVRGVRNLFFGSENLALATLTGPGRVFLQTMPFARLADQIISVLPDEKKGK
jgi:uncharacterized protein (AIM24 family)